MHLGDPPVDDCRSSPADGRTAEPSSAACSSRSPYLAITDAGHVPGRTVVVASRAIDIGERLDGSVLEARTITVAEDLAGHGFDSTDSLEDSIAIAPIGNGELVQHSAVLVGGVVDGTREFSFPVDRDRAVNGDLHPGESVDVLATYGSGNDATTTVLARDARVIRLSDAKSGALSTSGKLVLTLGLASADQVLDAVHAAQVASITIVRSTRAIDPGGSRNTTTGPLARAAGAR
jgi:Flp pilus assembly protein CpaB